MLRGALLYLSRQPVLRKWMETSQVAQPLTHRFVAGNTLDDAIAACHRVNGSGMLASLDHLGENVASAEEAARCRDATLASIDRIAELNLQATVSIKLTQFGLDLGDQVCWDNVCRLAERAKGAGTRVECDMEGSAYTERTIRIVTELHKEYGCVRAVIQAYLHRSEADIRDLSASGIPVRLCKGAYRESDGVALQGKGAVDANYVKLARILLDQGIDPALATHDERMTAVARGISPEKFEYQMLYGVRRKMQRRLVKEGYRLRVYIPYGDAWFPYFMRRLAERPANLWFVARSVLGR